MIEEVNVTDVPVQIEVVEVVIVIVGVTPAETTIVIGFEVAVGIEAHDAFDVKMHCTTSLFTNDVLVYVELFVPTFIPFTCHWYEGVVPPLVGEAVNVSEVPGQLGFVPLVNAIETLGVTVVVMFIVILFDNAVGMLAQGELDVIMHVTKSPFANEEEE